MCLMIITLPSYTSLIHFLFPASIYTPAHTDGPNGKLMFPIDHVDKRLLPKTSFKKLEGSKKFDKMLHKTELVSILRE